MFGPPTARGAYGISYTTAPLGALGQMAAPTQQERTMAWAGQLVGFAAGAGVAWYLMRGVKTKRKVGAVASMALMPAVGAMLGYGLGRAMS